jgi:hypothetical protein
MLAKPIKFAEGTALPTKSRPSKGVPHGETASTKRRQGIGQAVGRFAISRGLIQLRKLSYSGSRPCNVKGKAVFHCALWLVQWRSVGVEQDRGMVKEKRTK